MHCKFCEQTLWSSERFSNQSSLIISVRNCCIIVPTCLFHSVFNTLLKLGFSIRFSFDSCRKDSTKRWSRPPYFRIRLDAHVETLSSVTFLGSLISSEARCYGGVYNEAEVKQLFRQWPLPRVPTKAAHKLTQPLRTEVSRKTLPTKVTTNTAFPCFCHCL